MHTIGIDLVEVEAFQTAIDRTTDLYGRLFALEEQKDHKRAGIENLAAWFAGKEAVMKAIWSRVQVLIEWHDIMIFHGPQGQPLVRLSEALKERLKDIPIKSIAISLTHVSKNAAAVAMIEFD